MKRMATLIILLAIIACTPAEISQPDAEQSADRQAMEQAAVEPDVTIDMIARNWEFEPSEVRVKRGDRVRINVRSEDVAHGLAIEGYGRSVQVGPGENATLEFIADKTGEFRFSCNVYCGQGHRQMAGKLIVE